MALLQDQVSFKFKFSQLDMHLELFCIEGNKGIHGFPWEIYKTRASHSLKDSSMKSMMT